MGYELLLFMKIIYVHEKKCTKATFSIFSSCLSNCILSARNSHTHFTHIYMTTVTVNICLHHSYRVNTTKTITFKYLCIVSYRTTYVWRCFCVEPFLVCSTIFYLNFNSVFECYEYFHCFGIRSNKVKILSE